MRKRSKHVPTDIYVYLARQLAKYMMRLNSHVDSIRTQLTSTQHIPNSQVCSLDEIKSKGIIADKNLLKVCSADDNELKRVITDECCLDDSESKIVHISINTN